MTSLLEYVRENKRVCPIQKQWEALWESLPGRVRAGAGCMPEQALTYSLWQTTSDEEKRERLALHIRYAEEKGALDKIENFLRNLAPEEWVYEGDIELLTPQARGAGQAKNIPMRP